MVSQAGNQIWKIFGLAALLVFGFAACGDWSEAPYNNPLDPDSAFDYDGDGVPDREDTFPTDETETADTDTDGLGDNADNCPEIANADQADLDSDGLGDVCDDDRDADGLNDDVDNCPNIASADQLDQDNDGLGDICDPDKDGDGVLNESDAFPEDASESKDSDSDGLGDNADNCPEIANVDQANLDSDGLGDVCDDDRDGDDIVNANDAFPDDAAESADTDEDGVGDNADNCPLISNTAQTNFNLDAEGDACDDSDGDDVLDDVDNCILGPNADQADLDSDGVGDFCDDDKDGDGSPLNIDCDDMNAAVYIQECGDGFVCGSEICDDNDTDVGDGCDDSCFVESHWDCETSGFGPSECICSDKWNPADACVSCIPGWAGAECELWGYLLVSTNQTACFDGDNILSDCPGTAGTADCATTPFCGQDAQYSSEYSRVFTTETVEGDVIVLDSLTGFVWQQSSEDGMGWQDALDYCDSLNYGGQTDWRLPDVYELTGLLDQGRSPPLIDTSAFPDTPSEAFWTSLPDLAKPEDNAWLVGWTKPPSAALSKGVSLPVRCVRAGLVDDVSERFVISSTGFGEVVIDQKTGLVWQKDYPFNDEYDWAGALAYCEGLGYGGFDDWRLPDVNEFGLFLNYESSSPASDFSELRILEYWTSSSKTNSSDHAWKVETAYGEMQGRSKTDGYSAFCVRSGL
ncbi:DUF1566 domain-containing protein [Myxococcota bacterium]|nr:DUF1566 domain-containing protein [Myxococcota bacterium]